jgi:hypothetical protein
MRGVTILEVREKAERQKNISTEIVLQYARWSTKTVLQSVIQTNIQNGPFESTIHINLENQFLCNCEWSTKTVLSLKNFTG